MGTGLVGSPMAERMRPGVRALSTGRPQDGDSKGKETGWGCGGCRVAWERVQGKQKAAGPGRVGKVERSSRGCPAAAGVLGGPGPLVGRWQTALHVLVGAEPQAAPAGGFCFLPLSIHLLLFPNLVFLFSPSRLSARPLLPFLP